MSQSTNNVTFKAPSKFNTFKEITAPLDWLSTLGSLPQLLTLPKGDGRPIILVPGYMADDYSMAPLKGFLRQMNYDCYNWELGRNHGDVDQDIVRLGARTLKLFEEIGQTPITLIGWSLGGVLTREVARLFPECVREVITMGTPISGGPKYTAVGKRYAKRKNLDLDSFELHVLERNQLGFKQPVTSIYSKSDGVVGWQASIDIYNSHARNIEVKSTHMGLGINPKVWEIIAMTLASDE
ncbi:esterase/lipase family protein [Aliiglaciecola sp. M165]|uniref:esterase/lipase family protein n=1 Tax=Aliiglaciecola sp. M165 TaxID=2593649 RepID=UPI00117D5997|nr:alpha/beta hydrolase [Aliiglaciecola sp. M165]TRY31418.1 alpha/beta hydrolase [Aliiglaciecola sp. M165]